MRKSSLNSVIEPFLGVVILPTGRVRERPTKVTEFRKGGTSCNSGDSSQRSQWSVSSSAYWRVLCLTLWRWLVTPLDLETAGA